jgi:hypothetical protein
MSVGEARLISLACKVNSSSIAHIFHQKRTMRSSNYYTAHQQTEPLVRHSHRCYLFLYLKFCSDPSTEFRLLQLLRSYRKVNHLRLFEVEKATRLISENDLEFSLSLLFFVL